MASERAEEFCEKSFSGLWPGVHTAAYSVLLETLTIYQCFGKFHQTPIMFTCRHSLLLFWRDYTVNYSSVRLLPIKHPAHFKYTPSAYNLQHVIILICTYLDPLWLLHNFPQQHNETEDITFQLLRYWSDCIVHLTEHKRDYILRLNTRLVGLLVFHEQ
jgi:hypothetical protein